MALPGSPGWPPRASAPSSVAGAPPRTSATERRPSWVTSKLVWGDLDQTGSEDLDTVAAFTDRHASFCGPVPPTPDVAAPPRWLRDRPEVVAYFVPEASEHLDLVAASLARLERTGPDDEELAALLRTVHTLKGAAYTIGCAAMGDLAHQIEDLMVAVRAERMPLTPAVLDAVFAGVTASRLVLASIGGPQADLPAALERAASSLAALTPGSSPSAPRSGAATGPGGRGGKPSPRRNASGCPTSRRWCSASWAVARSRATRPGEST